MRVGFTGTRRGMSPHQKRQLREALNWFGLYGWHHKEPMELHEGEASGADREAKDVVQECRYGWDVVPHLPNGDPLARNRRIVAAVDVLIAAPETDEETLRSGTWATVRYARQKGIPVVFLSRGQR